MQDLCNFRNVKIVWALCIGTGKAFHKAGYGESSTRSLFLGEQKCI